MAKLEECTAINTLNTATLSLAEKELNDTEGKIAIIGPMLENIRKNIKFNSDVRIFYVVYIVILPGNLGDK